MRRTTHLEGSFRQPAFDRLGVVAYPRTRSFSSRPHRASDRIFRGSRRARDSRHPGAGKRVPAANGRSIRNTGFLGGCCFRNILLAGASARTRRSGCIACRWRLRHPICRRSGHRQPDRNIRRLRNRVGAEKLNAGCDANAEPFLGHGAFRAICFHGARLPGAAHNPAANQIRRMVFSDVLIDRNRRCLVDVSTLSIVYFRFRFVFTCRSIANHPHCAPHQRRAGG